MNLLPYDEADLKWEVDGDTATLTFFETGTSTIICAVTIRKQRLETLGNLIKEIGKVVHPPIDLNTREDISATFHTLESNGRVSWE